MKKHNDKEAKVVITVMPIMKYTLAVTEAASLMGYSAGKVYQLIHADALKAYKDGGGRIWRGSFQIELKFDIIPNSE